MSFSSRSLLSLARTALRLLSGSQNAAPPAAGRKRGQAHPSPSGTPTSRTATPKKSPSSGKKVSPSSGKPASRASKPAAGPARSQQSTGPGAAYPGDFRGKVTPVYAPSPDGSPDPGEVVWAWVPYEDDYSQGKDRPVLLIGRNGSRLLALMMTTRDRNNSRESDPDYVDVGTGSWDAQGRPSEVKLDRVLQLDPATVRRQGAVLPPAAFERVRKVFLGRR